MCIAVHPGAAITIDMTLWLGGNSGLSEAKQSRWPPQASSGQCEVI